MKKYLSDLKEKVLHVFSHTTKRKRGVFDGKHIKYKSESNERLETQQYIENVRKYI